MLKPDEILNAAHRRWPAVLRAEAVGRSLFPLRIPFGRPRPTADFALLRDGIEHLAASSYKWHIGWEEVETRKWGKQRLPVRIGFDTIEELAESLGRRDELRSFRAAIKEARQACPPLEPWLVEKAHRIPDYLPIWNALVSVCAYFDAHPRPHCYARQIPVALSSKFIEEHEGILRDMLDVVLGDRANRTVESFADRFHLLVDHSQIRFRFLDTNLCAAVSWPVSDCSIPVPSFANLQWRIPRVIIVENRDVFLCLPEIPCALAVFGSGKAASLIPDCDWLKSTEIVYWGDCDEAGYGILSSLRCRFPQLRSLLMDQATWCRWKHLAIPGKRDCTATTTCLTVAEKAALQDVLVGPWMLEQERIPADEAARAVIAAFV
jgi:hypothetical protein